MSYNIILPKKTGKMNAVIREYLKEKFGNKAVVHKTGNKIKNSNVFVIDFSNPALTMKKLEEYKDKNFIWIIGTTGFTKAQEKKIKSFSKKALVFKSGNMSYSVGFINYLLRLIVPVLQDYRYLIQDWHHEGKIDSPSGTAKMFAETIKKYSRHKKAVFKSTRSGKRIGYHCVAFSNGYEELAIQHTAFSRKIFVESIFDDIIPFLLKKKGEVGLYNMDSLFELKKGGL